MLMRIVSLKLSWLHIGRCYASYLLDFPLILSWEENMHLTLSKAFSITWLCFSISCIWLFVSFSDCSCIWLAAARSFRVFCDENTHFKYMYDADVTTTTVTSIFLIKETSQLNKSTIMSRLISNSVESVNRTCNLWIISSLSSISVSLNWTSCFLPAMVSLK